MVCDQCGERAESETTCLQLRRPPLPNFKDRSLELVSPGIAQQKIKQGVGRPAEFLPPRQRFEGVFSWLRLLHRKIYLFLRGVALKIERLRRRRLFWRRRRNFLDLSVGEPENPVFSGTPIGNYLSKGLNILG